MATIYEDLGSELTGELISAGIAVHRELGPGLNEEDYERALSVELSARGIDHQCQVRLPLVYKDAHLDCGYRIDLVVMRKLLVELKAVEKIHPVHEAQLITYLRLSGIQLGLLVNFAEALIRDGIMRRAHSRAFSQQSRPMRPLDNALDPLSFEVIEAAIEVLHVLGSGLLQSAYESAMEHELKLRGIKVLRRLPANLNYRGKVIPSVKEIPMVVDERIMICCVSVKTVEPVILARQRSLLKAASVDIGLCLNFNAESMALDIKRISRLTWD
jgi:GxxExxY protein